MLSDLLALLLTADVAERVAKLVEEQELDKAREVCARLSPDWPEECVRAERLWLTQVDAKVNDFDVWARLWTEHPTSKEAYEAREFVASVLIARASEATWPAEVRRWAGTQASLDRLTVALRAAEAQAGPDALYTFVREWPEAPQRHRALEEAQEREWSAAEREDTPRAWRSVLDRVPSHPRKSEAEQRLALASVRTLGAVVTVEWTSTDGSVTIPPGGVVPVTTAGHLVVRAPKDADVSAFVEVGGLLKPLSAVQVALLGLGAPPAILPPLPEWESSDPRRLALGEFWCSPDGSSATLLRVSSESAVVDYRVQTRRSCADVAQTLKFTGVVPIGATRLPFGTSPGTARSLLSGFASCEEWGATIEEIHGHTLVSDWDEVCLKYPATLGGEYLSLMFFRNTLMHVSFFDENCVDRRSYEAIVSRLPPPTSEGSSGDEDRGCATYTGAGEGFSFWRAECSWAESDDYDCELNIWDADAFRAVGARAPEIKP